MPRQWTPTRAFLLAILVGIVVVVASAWWQKRQRAGEFKELTRGVWVTSQISLADIRNGRLRDMRTLIDLRPDGEAFGQPASNEVAAAAAAAGVEFHYIPIPLRGIPDAAVAQLKTALTDRPHPALLYCGSGSRAARTWALSEASSEHGLAAAEIRQAVKAAGFATDDIDTAIDARIAARQSGAH